MSQQKDRQAETQTSPETSAESLQNAQKETTRAILELSRLGVGKDIVGNRGEKGLFLPVLSQSERDNVPPPREVAVTQDGALSREDISKDLLNKATSHIILCSDGQFLIVGNQRVEAQGPGSQAAQDAEQASNRNQQEYNDAVWEARYTAEDIMENNPEISMSDAYRQAFQQEGLTTNILFDSNTTNTSEVSERLDDMRKTATLIADRNRRSEKFAARFKEQSTENQSGETRPTKLEETAAENAVLLGDTLKKVVDSVESFPSLEQPADRTQPEN